MTDQTRWDKRPPLRCDECGMLCDDWTSFDGGVMVVCAPCLIDRDEREGVT